MPDREYQQSVDAVAAQLAEVEKALDTMLVKVQAAAVIGSATNTASGLDEGTMVAAPMMLPGSPGRGGQGTQPFGNWTAGANPQQLQQVCARCDPGWAMDCVDGRKHMS